VKYTETGGIVVRARTFEAADEEIPRHLRPTSETPAAANRPWIALQVIDTGIGIASADHTRIFEEFEQVTAGARGDSINRGTGLGLPISRRLARLLGGDVTLDSEHGKGSTFTIWLPGETPQS
jgi:signal transduction histidine kinase